MSPLRGWALARSVFLKNKTLVSAKWSQGFDPMTAGSCLREVSWPGALWASIAVGVHKEDGGNWKVELRPAFRLVNRTAGPLHVCYQGPLPNAAASTLAMAVAYGRIADDLLPAASLHRSLLHLHLSPAEGEEAGQDLMAICSETLGKRPSSDTHLRAWLGAGSGWSLPLNLSRPLALGEEVLRPAGLGADVPPAPAVARFQRAQSLHLQSSAPHPQTGQVTITFWPALLLCNGLPVPLMYRVGVRSPTAEEDGPLYASPVLVPPSVQAPVSAVYDGREVFSVQLSTSTEVQAADTGGLPLSETISRHLSVASSSDGSLDAALMAAVQSSTVPHRAPLPRQRSGWAWTGWGEDGSLVAGADGWTAPINVTTRVAGMSSRTSPRGTLSIPAAGYKLPARLLHRGAPLDCVLMAESRGSAENAEGSSKRLVLLPHAILHNLTSCRLTLHLPGELRRHAGPQVSEPFDWGPARGPARKVSISAALEGQDGLIWHSEAFSLKDGPPCILALSRFSSSETKGRSPPMKATPVSVVYLTVMVSLASTGDPDSPAGDHKTCHVVVTPTHAVSNLTPWSLRVHPEGAAGPWAPLLLPSGSSQALVCAWPPASAGTGGTAKSGPGSRLAVRVEVDAAEGGFGASATSVLLNRRGKQKCRLTEGGGRVVTCRVLTSNRGRRHMVVFCDPQPAVRVLNRTPMPVEVCIFSGESTPVGTANPSGAVQVKPSMWTELDMPAGTRSSRGPSSSMPPGEGRIEADSSDGAEAEAVEEVDEEGDEEGGEEADDEEAAFLDAISGGEAAAWQGPGQFAWRPVGAPSWSPRFPLAPGSVSDGGLQACVWQSAATMCVALEEGGLEASNSAAAGPAPLTLRLHVDNLEVALWDDERQRLRASVPQNHVRGPYELAVAVFDGVTLTCSMTATHRYANIYETGWRGRLAARAFQMDSYLDAARQGVLCASQPSGLADPLPLALSVQVVTCQGGDPDDAPKPLLVTTWCQELEVRVPPLVAAVDDALLELLDRAMLVLGPSRDRVSGDQAPEPHPFPPASPLQSPAFLAGLPESPMALPPSRDTVGTGSAGPGDSDMGPLLTEVHEEAALEAEPRLLIERLSISRMAILVDVHVDAAAGHLPLSLDTHRSPVVLPRVDAVQVVLAPGVIGRGLAAHYTAEVLLNAAGLVGSLDLLLNPTGLAASLSAGLRDLLGLPLAALQARSPTQFVTGVGRGSVSLVTHLSSWTLTSISGFSSALARVLQRSLAARSAHRGTLHRRSRPEHLMAGLGQGLQGLAGGVTAGVTGFVTAPFIGYNDGRILSGMGRGLLGAVGLPLSGALDLLSSVSAGLASSTVAGPALRARRPALPPGRACGRASADRLQRMALTAALAAEDDLAVPQSPGVPMGTLLQYLGHAHPAMAALRISTGQASDYERDDPWWALGLADDEESSRLAPELGLAGVLFLIRQPALALTGSHLLVSCDGGAALVFSTFPTRCDLGGELWGEMPAPVLAGWIR
eukprot:jgi/Botrbrau1/21473/Bobra.0216s0081.1